MDYLRSAYSSYMIFRTGDPPVKVTWQRAAPGAALFPTAHNFYSSNWNERQYQAGDIGEQAIVDAWLPPDPPGRPGKANNCMIPPSWWQTGIPAGQLAPPVDSNGVPLCCSTMPPYSCQGNPMPSTLTATFPGTSCSLLAGVSVTLSQLSNTGAWQGTQTIAGGLGDITLTFRFAGPAADATNLTFSTVGTWGSGQVTVNADPSSTCSPRAFNFLGIPSVGGFPCAGFNCLVS